MEARSFGDTTVGEIRGGAAAPRRLLRGLVAANLLVVALLAALTVPALVASRDASVARAEDTAESVANAFALNLEAELGRIDLALRTLADIHRQSTAAAPGGALARELTRLQGLLPVVDALYLADAEGNVRLGGVPAAAAQVGARDFFRAARAAPEAGNPAVSEPWIGAVRGRWVITVARPLVDAAGRFAGIVAADFPAAEVVQRFSVVDLGSEGALALRSATLRLAARRTAHDGASGLGTSNVSEELRSAVAANPASGVYVARTAVDGVERVNAFRRVRELPLYVLAGVGTADYLGPWRAQARQSVLLAAVVALVLAGASALVWRDARRNAAVQARLASESRRHRALLMTASDGIHVLDRGGRLVECNDAFAAMLGVPREALAGRMLADWDARFDRAALEGWLRSFAIGRQSRIVTRHRRADGSLIDVEVTSVCIRHDGEDLIFCASRDVTESRRLQAAVAAALSRAEEGEGFLQALTDAVPLRLAYHDRDGRYRFVNRANCERYGLPRERILGHTRAELTGRPDDPVRAAAFTAALAGEPRHFEHDDVVHGEVVRIEKRLVPDRGPDGSVRGVYVVGHDVTAQRAQQAQLEAALGERETLLREVYHRVKNNLQVVQSLLGLQRRAVPEGIARTALEESAQRVRAIALVHEKLYQTRSLSAVNLADYTADLLRQIAESADARRRGIVLNAEVDAVEAPLDLAVPYGLLVAELAGNALKHAFPERDGTVTVRLAADADGAMELAVDDDGVGLPEGFDLAAPRSLGLQLAASLAQQLGGRLRVEPGGRAAFRARLGRLQPGAGLAPRGG